MARADKFSFKQVMRSASSPHVFIVCIIAFMHGSMTCGLAISFPSIVNQLGFSPHRTQLLSVGPFAAGSCGKCFQKCDVPQDSRTLFPIIPCLFLQ